jgi:hypothetical protein
MMSFMTSQLRRLGSRLLLWLLTIDLPRKARPDLALRPGDDARLAAALVALSGLASSLRAGV